MKICLIEPPVPFAQPEEQSYEQNKYLFPNISMGYIGAVLEKEKYDVDIIECPGQNISSKKLYQIIEKEQYDMIGFITYYFDAEFALVNLSRVIQKIKKRVPLAYIFAGGYLASLCPEKLLSEIVGIDCCVIGEAEMTCLELAQHIEQGKNTQNILGIAYKNQEQIIINEPRHYIENLDEIPFPKRAFIHEKYPVATIISSRGCYGKCKFCVDRELYSKNNCYKIRYRSPQNVVAEIEYLVKNHQIKKILFCDDNFLGNSILKKQWLKDFCDLMKEKKMNITFRIDSRANDVIACKDNISLLKEVGLVCIYVGVETFLQEQLDYYGKGVTVEQNIKAIEIVRDADLQLKYGFIMLQPYTTLEEISKNIRILKKLEIYKYSHPCQDLHLAGIRRLFAPPGIELNTQLKEQQLESDNKFHYDFVDEKVSLFYTIALEWKERFNKYIPLYYLYNKAELNGSKDVVKQLINGNEEIKKLDLMFAEELCQKIFNNEISSKHDSYNLLVTWEEMIKDIFYSYDAIRSLAM